MFKNGILMITGGTGSFGNAVLSRFLDTDIKEIRVFSRDEKKQDDMRKKYKNEKIKYYIGDVRDYNSILNALDGVDYIFHAAALKQVPSCEFFPIEAVKTNVLGTENVLNAAIQKGVKKIVCLSTDKAAYPVNAMGISKSMMEKVFIAKSRNVDENKTMICGTRYGNVMGSRGSVIPLFIEQIRSGKNITVTDPKMTRFIMSLNEAVDLVLYAFNNARTGDIFVQKANSCYTGDLAIALKEIYKSSSDIQIIGSRHGEKMHEVLLTKEEAAKAIDLGQFYRVPSDNRELNYEKYLVDGSPKISASNEYNSSNTSILSIEEIKAKLLELPKIREDIILEE
jgi:UDP-glucose 4-epimerase